MPTKPAPTAAGSALRGGLVERGALDLARLERLEDVALAQVVEVLEHDPALEARAHLADVVLDAAQRGDRRLVDDGPVAHDAHLRVRADDAARDVAARDHADARGAEEGAHLDLADRLLGRDRGEHADERLLDVLRQLVDDAVRADLDALALRELARLGVRAHVEADDERVGRGGEVDVVLRDPADAGVDDVDAHLGVLDLRQLGDGGLDRALHVALEDEVELLDRARLHLGEQALEGDAAARLGRELLAAQTLRARVRDLARVPLVLDDAGELARRRRLVEADDLDRVARLGLLDLLPAVVVERAHAAPRVAGDDRVADAQRAAVDEDRRDGAAADVEARLDHGPGCLGVRVRAQVDEHLADDEDLLEQILEPLALLRGDAGDLDVAAPFGRLEALLRQLGEHAVGVRVGKVDLVDGDDDRHVGRARVRARLARLRHDAVVGGDDEHGDVRHLGAAGAHGGERLVARRVEEGDLAVVDGRLVGADVLRDPAGLGRDDGCLADRVEQRRLAVVDVAHDRDDRRARDERLLGVLEARRLFLLGGVLDRHLALQLGGDQLDLLVGERLRRRPHLAEVHQRLDDLRHRDAERLREVADGDAGLDGDRTGRLHGLLLLALAAVLALAGALPLVAGTRPLAAAVDDDAALAARRASAARADRSIGSAVGH